jgi:hypothetical protein
MLSQDEIALLIDQTGAALREDTSATRVDPWV